MGKEILFDSIYADKLLESAPPLAYWGKEEQNSGIVFEEAHVNAEKHKMDFFFHNHKFFFSFFSFFCLFQPFNDTTHFCLHLFTPHMHPNQLPLSFSSF